MTRENKKKPPRRLGNAGAEVLRFTKGPVTPLYGPEMRRGVIKCLAARISAPTRQAIFEAAELTCEGNSRRLLGIVAIAEHLGARVDPVAAFFGFLRTPEGCWRHLYTAYCDGDTVILPFDDAETCAALGLCRAIRSDRDRRNKIIPYRGTWKW